MEAPAVEQSTFLLRVDCEHTEALRWKGMRHTTFDEIVLTARAADGSGREV